jgi:hypothetical protein
MRLVDNDSALPDALLDYVSRLVWTAVVHNPRHRPAVQCSISTPQHDGHVLFPVCVLGNAFIDIETSLVAGIDLVDQAFNPVTLGFNDICVSTLIDLPSVVYKLCRTDEFASRTSPFHLQ